LYLSCTALNHDSSFRTLAHSGKEINDPFLKALALREEGNRSGKMTKMFNRCTGRSHQIIAEDVNDGEMIYKLFMNQTVDHLESLSNQCISPLTLSVLFQSITRSN
jgi:hypothetical protein